MREAGRKESLETRKSTERFFNGYRRQILSQRLRDTYFTLQTWLRTGLPVLRDVPTGLTLSLTPPVLHSQESSGLYWEGSVTVKGHPEGFWTDPDPWFDLEAT